MSQNTMGSNSRSVKRSDMILERLVNAHELTEAGKNWLIAAFDPFHDGRLEVSGYPDSNGSDSVCQIVTETFTVTAPAGQTENFDVHIVDFPFFGPVSSARPVPRKWQALYPDGSGAPVLGSWVDNGALTNGIANIGGIQAYTFNSAANNDDIFTGTVTSQVGVTLPNNYIQNPYRVIAKGWEVYNTTADLYKNGSVVSYKQPVQDYLTSSTCAYASSGSDASVTGCLSTVIMESPPSTSAEAILLTSSRQWDAREGVYMIPSIHSQNIPTNLGDYVQPMYYNTTPGDTNWVGYNVTQTGGTSSYAPANNNWMEFDQCGAIFSGLTPQSTLTVNVRWIIESFPTSGSILQTLAKPSPRCDPPALNLYSQLLHAAPIAVEVKFNGFGSWFNDAISSISDAVMPMVGTMSQMMPGVGGVIARAVTGKKKIKRKV